MIAAVWFGPVFTGLTQNPSVPESPFFAAEIRPLSNDLIGVSFPSDTNHLYEVEVLDQLVPQPAARLSPPFLGQPGQLTWSEPAPPPDVARYYRARRLAFDADADADSLANLAEFQRGTDLHAADTDADGLPDGWEVQYTLDPLGAAGADGATGDPDADGVGNLTEFQQGRNPQAGALPDDGDMVGLEIYTPWEER